MQPHLEDARRAVFPLGLVAALDRLSWIEAGKWREAMCAHVLVECLLVVRRLRRTRVGGHDVREWIEGPGTVWLLQVELWGSNRMINSNTRELLRREEVEARLAVSRSWIYSEMRAGRFPEPVKIGKRAVRWKVADLDEWAASRPVAHGDLGPP